MKLKSIDIIILICGLLLSVKNGDAWSSAQRLTWTGGASSNPCIAIDSSSNIHLVWADDTPGRMQIYYKKSPDGGATWTAALRLTWVPGGSEYPKIAVDPGDNLHVVWSDSTPGFTEIYYKQSTDGGATWGGARRLTWNQGHSDFPVIAADPGGGLHLAWEDMTPGNYEIFYKQSTDGGATWSAARRLTWNSGDSGNPFLLVGSSSDVHIFWNDYSPSNWEIYWKSSTDNGATWGALKRLTWTPGTSGLPSAANKSGHFYLAWHDDSPGDFEIFVKTSMDSGATWNSPKRLSWNSGVSGNPTIGVDADEKIHIIWHDDTVGNPELFYRKSTDSGVSWLFPLRLTWNSGASMVPYLAIDSGDNIHAVWNDLSPGNLEIFYKWQTGTIIE